MLCSWVYACSTVSIYLFWTDLTNFASYHHTLILKFSKESLHKCSIHRFVIVSSPAHTRCPWGKKSAHSIHWCSQILLLEMQIFFFFFYIKTRSDVNKTHWKSFSMKVNVASFISAGFTVNSKSVLARSNSSAPTHNYPRVALLACFSLAASLLRALHLWRNCCGIWWCWSKGVLKIKLMLKQGNTCQAQLSWGVILCRAFKGRRTSFKDSFI